MVLIIDSIARFGFGYYPGFFGFPFMLIFFILLFALLGGRRGHYPRGPYNRRWDRRDWPGGYGQPPTQNQNQSQQYPPQQNNPYQGYGQYGQGQDQAQGNGSAGSGGTVNMNGQGEPTVRVDHPAATTVRVNPPTESSGEGGTSGEPTRPL